MLHTKRSTRLNLVRVVMLNGLLVVACRHAGELDGSEVKVGSDAAPAVSGDQQGVGSTVRVGGAKYLGNAIDVVDLHMHPGRYEDLGPVGRDFLRASLPNALPVSLKDRTLSVAASYLLNPYGNFIGIKTESEQAGLSRVGLFAVYAPDTWGVTSNESVISYLDDLRSHDYMGRPFFFGLASLRLLDWPAKEEQALQQLRQALKHPKMMGIKLAFIHNAIPMNDPKYDSIYQVAQDRSVPVYHHIGSSPLRRLKDFPDRVAQLQYLQSYDPAGLERAIRKFPEVIFIMGHMGYDFNDEGYSFSDKVFELASRYPNVYLEISAFGDALHDPKGVEMYEMLKAIKARGLISRTLYGSDGPSVPGGTEKYLMSTLNNMEKLGFTHSEAEAVLGTNTRRVFKIID